MYIYKKNMCMVRPLSFYLFIFIIYVMILFRAMQYAVDSFGTLLEL